MAEQTNQTIPETTAEQKILIWLQRFDDRLDLADKQLAHLDEQLHEIRQFIDEHKPALDKVLRFADPGRSVRDYMAGRVRPGRRGE